MVLRYDPIDSELRIIESDKAYYARMNQMLKEQQEIQEQLAPKACQRTREKIAIDDYFAITKLLSAAGYDAKAVPTDNPTHILIKLGE
jgi:phage regulator Rha-like protein